MAASTSWLVKSGGRILGPFSHEDVCEKLKSRDLVLLDEIAAPSRRWLYIRDTEAFVEVIEEIRKANLKMGDDTMTDTEHTSTDSGTITSSITTALEGYSDDLTDEITFAGSKNREIVYDNLVETNRNANPGNAAKYKSFGYKDDREVLRKANKSSVKMWALTIGILLLASGFVVYKQFIQKEQDQFVSAQTQKELGLLNYKVGKYKDALENLRAAHNLSPEDQEIYLPLGILMIEYDGQTLVGKRLLEKVIDPELLVEASSGIGIANLYDDDHLSAEKMFNRALKLNSTYLPSVANLGAAYLKRGNYAIAKKYLEKSIRGGLRDGAAILMLAETNIYLWQQTKKINILKSTNKMLQKYVDHFDDYVQEALLYSTYIYFLLGKEKEAEKQLKQLIDIDPEQTNLHRHDLFLFRGFVSWNNNLSKCKQIYNKMKGPSHVKAFFALCNLKGGNADGAKRAIVDASHQDPKNPIVNALKAYIFQELNQSGESIVALGDSVQYNRGKSFKLPIILQGRYCQLAGDMDCAHKSWNQLIRVESSSLHALSGMAYYNFQRKNDGEVVSYLNRGLKRSAQYVPLLDLQEKIK